MKTKIGLLIFGLLFVLIFNSSYTFAKNQILTIDHWVPHTSTVPAITGDEVELYLREKVLAGIAKNFSSIKANGKVVLMIHGATVPGVIGYDFPSFISNQSQTLVVTSDHCLVIGIVFYRNIYNPKYIVVVFWRYSYRCKCP